MMTTKAIDRIRQLRTASKNLSGFWKMWSEKYQADSKCDKKAARFALTDRCNAFSANIGFECYAGYYGNSSVHTVAIANSDLVKPYLVRALNAHAQAIFATMAEFMLADAEGLTADAQDDIAGMQALLAEISGIVSPEEQPA